MAWAAVRRRRRSACVRLRACFLEPVIGRAIDYEDGRSDAEAALAVHEAAHEHGAHEHGVELFTRGVQANVGMGFGVLAFSVAMGALFAVAFAVVHGRMRTTRVRGLALVMAASRIRGGVFGPVPQVPGESAVGR